MHKHFKFIFALIFFLISTHVVASAAGQRGIVPVPVYSENNRSNFVNQLQNNIVLLKIER